MEPNRQKLKGPARFGGMSPVGPSRTCRRRRRMSVLERITDRSSIIAKHGMGPIARLASSSMARSLGVTSSLFDLPDGPSWGLACPAPFSKISLFPFDPNHWLISRHPVPDRGAFRDRHERRVWDAMDAAARKTKRAGSRTAKPCGPDAPTLAFKLVMMPAHYR
jgi:hypothetical protein